MSDSKFACIMFIKIQTLCDSIKNYFNISYKEADVHKNITKYYKNITKI